MKKILLLFALVGHTSVYAQDSLHAVITSPMSVSVAMDSAYGSLDTNRISTRYLLDLAGMNFGPGNLNGLDSEDIDTIGSTTTFYQIYSCMYHSQVSSHPHFTAPLAFAHSADSLYKASNDTIMPIMLFYGRYNSIDTNAIPNNWILTTPHSVRLLDAETTIPYDTFGVFAGMADRQKITANKFYFSFRQDMFAANVPFGIGLTTISVDLGDGHGWHALALPTIGGDKNKLQNPCLYQSSSNFDMLTYNR